jgi:hypothetical protein
MNNLRIKGPRQRRAVAVLLEGPVTVKDMGPKIGALNPRQVIFELRQQCFKGIIITRRFSVIDQDGKRCRPGKYDIPAQFKPMVEQALKESLAQAATKRLGMIGTTHNRDNSRGVM